MSEAIPTIYEAAAAIAAREISPVELTRACLDRAARLDGVLNSFLLLTPERALSDARAAETRVMRNKALGPLDGIPIAHKDILDTAGIRTTAHSRLLEDNVPDQDAAVVRRLAEAGTAMLGKLATHEFALGGPAFDLPWPPARNPWNPARFTGGSSSGTGAAVAAGLVLGGTGTDTGGSIRGPSAFCGLAGIKPTYGLVSRAGIQPLSFTLDHAGPMAWTMRDCGLLLAAMAGHDPADPSSASRPVPNVLAEVGQGVKGLRIGVVRHFHDEHPVSDPTRSAVEEAVALLAAAGAEVRDVRLPSLWDFSACGWTILLAEAFAVHEPWLRADYYRYGTLLRERLALGGVLRSADYIQALRRRRLLCQETARAMENLDLLVVATQKCEAPLMDAPAGWAMLERPGLLIPFNVTGLPAASLCIGFGPEGLPLGMQLVGKPFSEALLIRVGDFYEEATSWRRRRPAPDVELVCQSLEM